MSISYLPEDLLIPVFASLPPKSLGRFKCLSKSWNALISSQEFMKLHQKQVISIHDNTPNIIIVSQIPDVNPNWSDAVNLQLHLLEYSTTAIIGSQNNELSSKIQLLDHPFDYLEVSPWLEATMVGSCNGLLCQFLHESSGVHCQGEYDIFLCNPVTKSLWNLPQRPVVLHDDGMTEKLFSFCGFGYDDFHDDYKVMVASRPSFFCVNGDYINNGDDYEYQVYSLRSNAWSIVRSYVDIRYHFVDDTMGACPPGVFVNCALHWVLLNGIPNYADDHVLYSILAFDIRTNKNHIFQVPHECHRLHKLHLCKLSVMNGCLVLNISDPRSSYDDVDFWVMNEYGLKDSWTRITIHNSPLLRSLSPIHLLEEEDNHKGKLIYHNQGTILSYDLVSHKIQEFPASRRLRYAKQMFHFVGSLIQPHPEPLPPSFEDRKTYRLEMKTYQMKRSKKEAKAKLINESLFASFLYD